MTQPPPPTDAAPASHKALAVGYAATAAIGLLLAYPVLFGEMLVRQLAGRALDAPWAPFGTDAEGKTQLSVLVVLFVGAPLLLAAIAIGQAIRRRIGGSRRTATLHYLASSAILLLPFLWIRFG